MRTQLTMLNSSFPSYGFSTETEKISNITQTAILPESGQMLRYDMPETVVVSIVTSTLTLVVILGNALILISMIQVQKLRNDISNYLIASLAVSDMLVGIIVMPIAMIAELLVEWPLGKDVCLIWVTSDVTLCTSSILHLMLIAVDRYCLITNSFEYMALRESKNLIIIYIVMAWLVSAMISLTPVIIGWFPDYGSNGKGCKVNQQIEYQMYATFVAFYIPLIVKLCLYGKLYFISRRISKSDARNKPHLGSSNNEKNEATSSLSHPSTCTDSPVTALRNGGDRHQPREMVAMIESNSSSTLTINVGHHLVLSGEEREEAHTPTESDWLRKDDHHGNHLSVYDPHLHDEHVEHGHHPHPHSKRGAALLAMKRLSVAASTQLTKMFHSDSHRKGNAAAVRTIGAIMGLFTICWLPFFVLAVVSPLCNCVIEPIVYSIFLWVGYANSCFNPFIYAQFNQVWRLPFKEIMCCRCKTVDESMRRLEYNERYGKEEETT